mmetsp:Transcript_16544/g.39723  ORF Transcript_16544/g.39723 Transcript_16544/m.39723 type:complete len:223 (-) Transcript_16544:156-824(-)
MAISGPDTGGMGSRLVAVLAEHPGLVERDPVFDHGQLGKHDVGESHKGIHHFLLTPIKSSGEVPVVEGDDWLDPCQNQRVCQLAIELDPWLVPRRAVHHTGPADGKPEVGHVESPHHLDVLRVFVVEIISNVTRVVVFDFVESPVPARLCKDVPYARHFPGRVPRSLDLIGGRGSAPHEGPGDAAVLGECVDGRRQLGRHRLLLARIACARVWPLRHRSQGE